MSAETILARGRQAAEALMVDACTVTRVTDHTTDKDTGVQTSTIETIYPDVGPDGKCRIQQTTAVSRPHVVGGALVYQLPFQVQLPMSVTSVQVADVVTVTASAHDPDLIGRTFWVREIAHKTHATSRRLGLEEVTS